MSTNLPATHQQFFEDVVPTKAIVPEGSFSQTQDESVIVVFLEGGLTTYTRTTASNATYQQMYLPNESLINALADTEAYIVVICSTQTSNPKLLNSGYHNNIEMQTALLQSQLMLFNTHVAPVWSKTKKKVKYTVYTHIADNNQLLPQRFAEMYPSLTSANQDNYWKTPLIITGHPEHTKLTDQYRAKLLWNKNNKTLSASEYQIYDVLLKTEVNRNTHEFTSETEYGTFIEFFEFL